MAEALVGGPVGGQVLVGLGEGEAIAGGNLVGRSVKRSVMASKVRWLMVTQ